MISDRDPVIAAVHDLAERLRTPVCAYIYQLRALRNWASRVRAQLPSQCRLFYALKANSEPAILDTLAGIVDGFEVASAGEIRKARGAAGEIPILFGGPGKTDEEIEAALAQQVKLIHVESLQELRRVELAGARRSQKIPVLLRVNLRGPLPGSMATLKMCGSPTQFGIDELAVPTALAAVQRCSHVLLRGFHLHSLSNNLDAQAHIELIRLYLSKVAEWQRIFGQHLGVLNVGGGIGVSYTNPDIVFDWTHFCAQLSAMLAKPDVPELIFESGRFITAGCGYYAVEVIDLKQNHGATFAVVRGGSHQFRLPVSWQHSQPFIVIPLDRWPYPFERPEVLNEVISVAGQLCTPKDVLARNVRVARLRLGDVLLFTHAGAYGWSISHHDFLSHPHPEMVYVS